MATVTEQQLITQAVLDHFVGWYDGDVDRMDRALHPRERPTAGRSRTRCGVRGE